MDTSPYLTVELAKVRANTTYVVANSTVRGCSLGDLKLFFEGCGRKRQIE
jgi:hypothetical protein